MEENYKCDGLCKNESHGGEQICLVIYMAEESMQ